MTGSVVLLGFSGMVIDQARTDFLQGYFLMRVSIYSVSILVMCAFCKVWAWRKDRWEGTMLATNSGLLISFSSPFLFLTLEYLLTSRTSRSPTFGSPPSQQLLVASSDILKIPPSPSTPLSSPSLLSSSLALSLSSLPMWLQLLSANWLSALVCCEFFLYFIFKKIFICLFKFTFFR
jgi:hypothetical protein